MSHADERCPVWSPVWHRARKHRRCRVCREAIESGTEYVKLSTCYEGAWTHSHHCGRCWTIFEAVCRRERQRARDQRDYPQPLDPLLNCGESWADAFGEPEPDDVAALAFMLPHEVRRGS